jgi:hypothetical protein
LTDEIERPHANLNFTPVSSLWPRNRHKEKGIVVNIQGQSERAFGMFCRYTDALLFVARFSNTSEFLAQKKYEGAV